MCAQFVTGNNRPSGMMESVRNVALAVAVGAAAATLPAGVGAAHQPRATKARSGLYGVLYRGPTTPVCRIGIPCEAPAPGVTLIFTRPGSGLAPLRTKTGTDGSYRALLPAAIYTVDRSA